MCKITGFVLASFLAVAHMQLYLEPSNFDHVEFVEVALYMIRNYISPKTNTLIVMEGCTYCIGDTQGYHKHLMEHFLRNFDGDLTIQLLFNKSKDKPWDYNLFIIDSHWAFILFLRSQYLRTMHERQFYFFILLTYITTDPILRDFVMEEIFEACLDYNVIDAVIMYKQNDGSYGFFVYRLFTENTCSQTPYVDRFNSYRNGRLEHDVLFPDRLVNLYNCTLNISVNNLYPMLLFRGDRNNAEHMREMWRLIGIDGDLLNILAKALHFRVQLHIPEGISLIGRNYNSTGCFGDLEAGKAELALGALISSQGNYEIFSPSVTYHQSAFHFVVRSGLHFGAIQQFANPFNWQVWGALGFVLLLAVCFIQLLYSWAYEKQRNFIFGHRTRNPVVNLITILLGNPVTLLPRRNFARFLLMSWLLITFILRNAYQGKMFDSLRTSKRMPIPNTIEEMIQRKYILFSSRYYDFYPENLTSLISNTAMRFKLVQESNALYATLSLLDTLAVYNQFNWETSYLTFVSQPIYTYQMVIYFRKHSIYKMVFDRKLKQLISSGITSHIAKKYINKDSPTMNCGNRKVSQISNQNLMGIYIIYMCMCFEALIVFVLELGSRRCLKLRRCLDWLHYSGH